MSLCNPAPKVKPVLIEVKNCPWCDELPGIRSAYDQGATWWQIGCCNPNCPVHPTTEWGPKLKMAKEWNQRNLKPHFVYLTDHHDTRAEETCPRS